MRGHARARRTRGQSVRIIGGEWRGRRIEFPDVPGLRPSPDRVRETLFNWLREDLAGARCLDLFAGSGVLGLEALSRGAREAVLVERAPAVVEALRRSIETLGASARAKLIETDAAQYLAGSVTVFDGVFLDPPFGQGALLQYVPWLAERGWVAPGGWVYLESERAAGPPLLPEGWSLAKSKVAGEVGYHLARVRDRGSS